MRLSDQIREEIEDGHILLPTPVVNDMGDGKTVERWDEWTGAMKSKHGNGNGHGKSLAIEAKRTLLPTLRATRGGSATETAYGLGGHREDDERPQGQVTVDPTDWGPYKAAVERWGRVLGRTAPAPVRYDGKGGKARLNPELTEWMMGWPAGHVTDPDIGLTRAEQLKACGNGVVPQQAEAALRELLSREGVPSV
jgi:DNA (cytosine-5)-methyltransferase 1